MGCCFLAKSTTELPAPLLAGIPRNCIAHSVLCNSVFRGEHAQLDSELGSGPLVMLANLSSSARKGLVAAACLGAGALGFTGTPTENKSVALGVSVFAIGATAAGSTVVLQNTKRLSKRASADVLAGLGPTDPNLSSALMVVKEEYVPRPIGVAPLPAWNFILAPGPPDGVQTL